jgi:signal transduction histidine kinase
LFVGVLVILELMILAEHLNEFGVQGKTKTLLALLGLIFALTGITSWQIFALKNARGKAATYYLELAVAVSLLFFTYSTYTLLVYMLVLTAFYIAQSKRFSAIKAFGIGTSIYLVGYALNVYIRLSGKITLFDLIMQSFTSVFALIINFVVVQVALAFYRQFVRLEKAHKELDESKKELEKAYAVVAEVTALEERQRIAKDIHDTAGHSITTVIMQTEAAKLIISEKPEEAKQKIVAANLQAKHALEELRDSVHLLSGDKSKQTLVSALQEIVHESTDGTGITVRSDIQDAPVSPTKFRFICNTLKEGISNGLRHGGATAFWFECKTDGDKIVFLLSDNGRGVDGEIPLGFGLTGMKDRAKSLGGEIRFASEKDEGFEIHLTLPMDTED